VAATNYVGSATNTLTVLPPPPVVLSIAAGSPGTVIVSWNSISNLTYRVQYKNNLADANWIALPPDITATGPITSVTNVVGSQPQRFFRVEWIENAVAPPAHPPVTLSLKAGNTGSLIVSWNSVSNQTYRLQFKNSLTDGSWTDLLPDITATASLTSVTNIVGEQPQRFFRVHTTP
jgi:hypothetical protein